MHIAINGMFWSQPNVGSGQYVHGLLDGLAQIAPQHRYTLLVPTFDNRRPTTDHREIAVVGRRLSVVNIRTPFDGRNANLAKVWFEQIGVPRAARRLGADVLHVPYFAPPLVARVPVVTTILDLIPLLLPEYRGSAAVRAYMRLVAAAAPRSAEILTLSEHSRGDIIAHLGCAPERVTAVLLAAGAHYRPLDAEHARAQVAKTYGLDAPFVYYVGGLDARKNVPTLLRAWSLLLRAGGPPATLAIAGRAFSADPVLFPDLDALIAGLGIADSVRRIDVPRDDGPLLYSAATVFAAPSRYEGFGLGPLEALACGAPVIIANASSLPEVVGDAALRVAPDDVQGWATALWRLLTDEPLRATLQQRGFARAAQFSYTKVARKTLAAYERATHNHTPRPQ